MISVILMAYGSPTRMEDVMPYLQGIYEGKPVPEYAVKENTEKYAMANGVSPSNAIVDRIVERLGKELSAHGQFNVILGNKHWTPSLSDAISKAEETDSDRIIAIPLFPFRSTNVKNSYLEPTLSAMKSKGISMDVRFVNGFLPEELSTMWYEILRGHAISDKTAVLFDAHSLPLFRGSESEYDNSFRETAKLTAEKMGVDNHFYGYQSRGKYGKTWLEPSVYHKLDEIREEGFREVIAVPIGFIYEHLEILYDLDYEFGRKVQDSGLRYSRTDLPNDSPAFISILKNHVLKEAGEMIEQS